MLNVADVALQPMCLSIEHLPDVYTDLPKARTASIHAILARVYALPGSAKDQGNC